MKKIVAILLLSTCFMCACKQEPKEEYILILEDTDTNTKYFVATPSGAIYYKATDSEMKPFMRNDKVVNITDYE